MYVETTEAVRYASSELKDVLLFIFGLMQSEGIALEMIHTFGT